MKRIRIVHNTEYRYNQPVTFGPHRVMMRPREGHDVHIVQGRLDVEPTATVRWLRDIYSNSIAILTFTEPSRLIHYRLPSYPYDGPTLQHWLRDLYRPGQVVGTLELLERLNTHIHQSFAYAHRDDAGVQIPCDTLKRRSGSCRDFAVLMMEAVRHWGFGARFVTGYIQMNEGQHGATHAWTEVYLPGAGWRGFDPTNNKLAGNEHVSVAVAREQEKACPLAGTWEGPANAFNRMEVSVQVAPV
jgi:transglutaminase-like putative cysteine protease